MTRNPKSEPLRSTSLPAGVFAALAFLALAFCNATAADAPRLAADPSQPSIEVIAPAPAMRVSIDPATGRLSMPAPDVTALQPLWSVGRLPNAPLPVVHLADGSMMVDLEGIFLTNAVASIGWDGHPTIGCAEFGVDLAEYARMLSLTARPARARGSE